MARCMAISWVQTRWWHLHHPLRIVAGLSLLLMGLGGCRLLGRFLTSEDEFKKGSPEVLKCCVIDKKILDPLEIR